MKAIPFTIPYTKKESFHFQEDILEQFYPHFHEHPEMQLSWIVKGTGTLILNHQFIPFKDNSLFLIGAHQAHMFKSPVPGTGKVHSLGIYFNLGILNNTFQQIPELENISIFLNSISSGMLVPLSNGKDITDIMESMRSQTSTSRFFSFLKILDILSSLEANSFGFPDYSKASSVAMDERLKIVLEYTFKHFRNDIKLDEMAKLTSFTIPSFCRFFRKRTGKTFVSYLNEIRIEHAAQLLVSEPTKTINEIAYTSGFKYVQHFNRTFLKFKRLSPSAYRKISSSTVISY